MMSKRTGLVSLCLISLVIAGCSGGGKMQLIPKSAVTPSGTDLSGKWRLRDGDAAIAGQTVHMFLETGTKLKVTQTPFGLFVSFDRSIVEEYRFGEHRIVNVGPISAERVSGWENDTYVIETLDEDGALLREIYRLDDDGTVMIRTITVTNRDKTQLSVEQVFVRS